MNDTSNISLYDHLAKIAADNKRNNFVGTTLYFAPKKGEVGAYQYGKRDEKREIELGTKLAVVLKEMRWGHTEFGIENSSGRSWTGRPIPTSSRIGQHSAIWTGNSGRTA